MEVNDEVSSAIFKFYLEELSSMPFRVVMCISQTDFFVSGLPGYCTAVMTTQVLTRKTIGVWDLTLEAGILAGNGWGTASKEKKTKCTSVVEQRLFREFGIGHFFFIQIKEL